MHQRDFSVNGDRIAAALVVHAGEDDRATNNGPAGPGNSGARFACGVLQR
jgi:Cu/Zn superoxide dismutase